jgi:hypothetical protein
MLLLLSHDIMITPYLLRIMPYHAILTADHAISRHLLRIAKPYCGMLRMAYSYLLYEYLYAFYAFYITYA